ncbi:hypothetical protein [Candidatus Proelusimicrobium excrementi]|uniref:hypothetical protein n=1 Tax=Candidatus Proelusimicrobium excrementi TaxID=3416222 RepID=UPI003CBD3143|nr:hypothetical protein [Elusimicrobiaceae bacterium]
MKKCIALFLFINILCACSGTTKSLKQKEQHITKIIKDNYVEIKIPIKFSEIIEEAPTEFIDEETYLSLVDTKIKCLYSTGTNLPCNIKDNYLNLILVGYNNVKAIDFEITPPWNISELKNKGIDVIFDTTVLSYPIRKIFLRCKIKSCILYTNLNTTDTFSNDKISIVKKISFNKNRLKEIKQEQAKQLKEQVQEKLKREAEDERRHKKQNKICPYLFYTIRDIKYEYTISPPSVQLELGKNLIELTKEFQEYECHEWVSREYYKYKILGF